MVDSSDREVGACSKKSCHLNSNISTGLLHRAFSVFLFDSSGRYAIRHLVVHGISDYMPCDLVRDAT